VKLEPLTAAPPPPAAPGAILQATAAPDPQPSGNASTSTHNRTLAIVATLGAVGLAAGGIGAYVVAGSEHSDAVGGCATMVTVRTDACDSQRNTVRTWDWVAVGAWAGALAAGTLATVSFIRARHDRHDHEPSAAGAAHLVLGPASIGLGGTF
jgi:hypothetical protein